jgi:hypothetical protein
VEKEESMKQLSVVTGKAYRELFDWLKGQDANLTSLVMRKTRDAQGNVDWISPKNFIAWVSKQRKGWWCGGVVFFLSRIYNHIALSVLSYTLFLVPRSFSFVII